VAEDVRGGAFVSGVNALPASVAQVVATARGQRVSVVPYIYPILRFTR
jgi:hypothetical protein